MPLMPDCAELGAGEDAAQVERQRVNTPKGNEPLCATILLHGWHQVVMNTEGPSKAMRNLAFLD